MAQFKQWFEQDFTEKIEIRHCESVMFTGDDQGAIVGVYLYDNGTPYSGGGTVNGFVKRTDGGVVVINGTLSGNAASIILPAAALAYAGPIGVQITLTQGGQVTTILKVIYSVDDTTGTPVDPGSVMPSLPELIAEANAAIAAMEAKGQQVIASIPADYTALTEDVAGLHNSLTIDGLQNGAIIPVSMYTLENTIIKGNGTDIQTISNFKSTPLIELYTHDLLFTGGFFPYDLYNTFVLYDASMNVLCRPKGDTTVKLSDYPTAKYMRASMSMVDDTYYVKIDHEREYEYLLDLNKYYTSPDPIRLPDSYYTLTDKMLNSTATDVVANSGWNTTPYIELFSNDVCFSGSFFPATAFRTFALYDKDYTVLAFGTYNNVLRVSDFPTAKYFRASMAVNDPNAYYVNISNSDPRKTIHVGPGQAFETLRAGVNMATGLENSTVIVHAGTYDLTQEFASEIAAATGGTKGIHLYNGVHVIFLSGAYVTALFPQSSAWISNYFNPFYGRDFTLEGLNIKASNCRYCVHDEQAGANVQYHNVFKDCVMQMAAEASSGATLLCTQCIGGGLGKYGYIEVIGGHYTSLGNNGVDGRPAISYHNGGTAGCDSKLFFRDLYIAGDGFLRFGCHGPSSIKSQVYVSGCSMGAAIKKFYEEPADQTDNFEIVEWNNTIR